jgi:hypothetical protein
MCFPFLERSLSLLNPWLVQLDLDASNQIDSRNDRQMNHISEALNYVLEKLFFTEQNMASVTIGRLEFDAAEGHCQRCLAISRRYGLEGEDKTTDIFTALVSYSNLREIQGDSSGAVAFAEEAYNLVVEAYDPVHPQVQQAAGILIRTLIWKGDLFDAERYAQVTYGNLRDKKNGMDQEGDEMATGAFNLASVILHQNGDLIRAEVLARESLRIRSLINDDNDQRVGGDCNLLANVLRVQGQLGDETRRLYERYLAISIRGEGPDGRNTATGHNSLGSFSLQIAREVTTVSLKQTQLLLAKSHYEETLRISSKIYGHTHSETDRVISQLSVISIELAKISLA